MSDNLEWVIGAVGIVIFTLVFMAGIAIVQDSENQRDTEDRRR